MTKWELRTGKITRLSKKISSAVMPNDLVEPSDEGVNIALVPLNNCFIGVVKK